MAQAKGAHASKKTSAEWVAWAQNQGWTDIDVSETAGKVLLFSPPKFDYVGMCAFRCIASYVAKQFLHPRIP